MPFTPSSGIAIQVHNNTVTTKIDRSIRDAVAAKPLRDYICTKEKWTLDTFHCVDWNAMYRVLKGIGLQRRISATKYMFHWQNTGAQKQRFETGRAHTEQREEEIVHHCPLQCGSIEVAQHFLHCPILHQARIADISLQSLYRWFAKTKTNDHIKNVRIGWLFTKTVDGIFDETCWNYLVIDSCE